MSDLRDIFQEGITGVKRDLAVRSHYSSKSSKANFCPQDALSASVVEFSFKGSSFLHPFFFLFYRLAVSSFVCFSVVILRWLVSSHSHF